MESQDFERLKAVCEKEGFDLELSSPWDQTYRISKNDIWEGVEFVKIGKIHKVKSIQEEKIYLDSFDTETWVLKSKCTKSTESAYIEQLKAEAFKRFGEIKLSDRFEGDWIRKEDDVDDFVLETNPNKWDYIKVSDRLFLANASQSGGAPIYCKGKWATRVPERVKVELVNVPTVDSASSIINFDFKLSRNDVKLDYWKFLKDLTNYIEQYLNKEE